MSQADRQTLRDKTHQLLQGPLKHARTAALAASLVPLASVAAAAANGAPCEFYSGGLGASLIDPVPDLLDGRRVTTNTAALSNWSKGRWVMGVGADGVSQVVLRISGNFIPDGGSANPETFTVTVLNSGSSPSESVAEDGGVGIAGAVCPGAGCESHQVTVTTSCIDNTPMAFAVYRSPSDFPRTSVDDSGVAGRDVYIRIESVNGSMDLPVRILRPPVVLIHGLWDNAATWNKFSPLLAGRVADWRFNVNTVEYGELPVSISSSSPPLTLQGVGALKGNAMGFAFNRDVALQQIVPWLKAFRQGTNPEYIPVASVQADLVGHSMGGDIARALVLSRGFLSNSTFGEGFIHKLITIDTPHLGSALATRFLMPDEYFGCLQKAFGNLSKAVLTSAVVNGQTVSGAVGDLVDSPMSAALQQLATQNLHPLPTAMIVGVYSNWPALDASWAAWLLQHRPAGCPSDPLAQQLNTNGWKVIFNNQENDGIVQRTSQENGLNTNAGRFDNHVHSPGTEDLGFAPPSVLDAPDGPLAVIALLNTPMTTQAVYKKINP